MYIEFETEEFLLCFDYSIEPLGEKGLNQGIFIVIYFLICGISGNILVDMLLIFLSHFAYPEHIKTPEWHCDDMPDILTSYTHQI